MELKKQLSEEIYKKIDYAKSIASMEPEKSIKLSEEVYMLAKDNKLVLEEADALLSIALGCRAKTDMSNMLDYSYRALALFKEINNIEGRVRSLNLIGIAYFYASIYEEALKHFLEAYDLVKFLNENLLKVSILNNIGEIYRESGIYDKAIEYYTKAIGNMNDFSVSHATILSNIGEIHFDKNEFSKALEVYEESYAILIDCKDMITLGEVENKIGKTYFVLGDFEKAEDFYMKSLQRHQNTNNKYYSIDTLLNLGNLYIKNSTEKAFEFYYKAIKFSKKIGNKKKLCKAYDIISNYYEDQGDYKNAIKYYKRYSNTNEEIISLNLSNKLEILNIDIKNLQGTEENYKIQNRLENEITRQKNEIKRIKETNELLQKKAYEDELTGLKNRRSINIYIKKVLEEIDTKEDKIVLFMIDIDYFKRYNDYWGHSEGDLCLKKISKCIKEIQVNRGDVFGRYGGEEFVYISTSINYKDALILGDLIRKEVEDMGIYYMYKGKNVIITISVGGIMGLRTNFCSMAEIMELSDKELYKAKERGRNITIIRDVSSV